MCFSALSGSWRLEPKSARRSGLTLYLDFPERLFILLDVFSECVEEKLRMLWSGNDAGKDFCLRHTGQDARKINDEFRRGVRDDGKIRINSLGFLLAQFDVDLLLRRYL